MTYTYDTTGTGSPYVTYNTSTTCTATLEDSLQSNLANYVGWKDTPEIRYDTTGSVTVDTSCMHDCTDSSFIKVEYTTGGVTGEDGYVRIYGGNEGLHINGNSSLNWSDGSCAWHNPKADFKEKMKSNLLINVKSRADIINGVPKNEAIAIETLREEISEAEFRKYLKYGFINVPGKGDKTFQVFRNDSHIKVWKGGKLLEEICVRISDSKIPPTDNVIAMKALITANEEEFRKLGNIYPMADAA